MIDATLTAEPIENSDATEPTEPPASSDPTEPIDRIEPLDPIERIEPSERIDHSDGVRDSIMIGMLVIVPRTGVGRPIAAALVLRPPPTAQTARADRPVPLSPPPALRPPPP